MVVEVHDPDGDRGHGLGSWGPCRADLSHLGWGQVAMAVWQADSKMAPMIPASSWYSCPYVISSFSVWPGLVTCFKLIEYGRGDEISLSD